MQRWRLSIGLRSTGPRCSRRSGAWTLRSRDRWSGHPCRTRKSPRHPPRPLRQYLDLATLACAEHLDRVGVPFQRQTVANEDIGIKQAVGEELSRPLEAVQY